MRLLLATVLCTAPGRDLAEDSVPWVLLVPEEARSEGGATLSIEPDGSVRATGANPATDVHVVSLVCELEHLTALRLEALPDPALPAQGPGRSGNGAFVVTDLEVEAAPRLGTPGTTPVGLHHASATFAQDAFEPSGAVDSNPDSGWAILPRAGKVSELWVNLKADAGRKGGTRLRLRLVFAYGNENTLGRYRLWATAAAPPVLAPRVEEGPWSQVRREIPGAIARGVAFLLDRQERDGSFAAHLDGYPSGQTALCLYALLKSGLDAGHPAVQRAAAFVRVRTPVKTYENACQILALALLGDPADRALLEERVELLVGWQHKDGGYAYPDGAVDLSNTQMAAFALNVAAGRGVRVPSDTFQALGQWTLSMQEQTQSPYQPAGFRYHADSVARASMTTAGVAVLAICEERLGRRASRFAGAKLRGIQWLVEHYSVTANGGSRGRPNGDQLYYTLYGLERVAALCGLEKLGPFDWYQDGARFLLRKQEADGGFERGDLTATSFALLFLEKATAVTGATEGAVASYGSDDPAAAVSLRASGDTPLTLWISSYGAAAGLTPSQGDGAATPAVREVRYYAQGEADADEVLLATVDGAGDPRGAIRHRFARNGTYALRAEVDVADAASPEGLRTLASALLQVPVRGVLEPGQLEYASDAARDLLLARRLALEASSERPGFEPRRAVDGFLATSWMSADGDNLPTLRIVLEEPVRANALLLTRAVPAEKERTTRIRTLRLLVNGRGDPLEVELRADDRHKTVVRLPKPTVVRRLDLAVTSTTAPADLTRDSVGLAEVELVLRREEE